MVRSVNLMVVGLLLAVTANVFAGGGVWLGDLDSIENRWTTASNWEHGVPTSADNTYVVGSRATIEMGPVIEAGDVAVTMDLHLGKGGWGDAPVAVHMNGGSFTANGIYIGIDDNVAPSDGTFNLNDGDLVTGTLVTGFHQNATFNQRGGTVTVTGNFFMDFLNALSHSESAVYNLYDGTLDILGGTAIGERAVMNFEEGIARINGNFTPDVDVLVSLGRLKGYDGAGKVYRHFDGSTTTIWAQPSATSDNFLVNGSFENPDIAANTFAAYISDIWSANGVTLIDDASLAADGDQFVELAAGSKFVQEMSLQPGTYMLSFKYAGKIDVAGTKKLTITTFDKQSSTGGPENIAQTVLEFDNINTAADPNWLVAEYYITVLDGMQISVVDLATSASDPELWLDDIVVTACEDLVSNGSFESPDIASDSSAVCLPSTWTGWGITVIDDIALAADGDQFIELAPESKFVQEMSLDPGNYKLTFNCAGKIGLEGTKQLTITTFDKQNSTAGPENIAQTVLSFDNVNQVSDPNWLTAEYEITVLNGMQVSVLDFATPASAPELWLDNVVVAKSENGLLNSSFELPRITANTSLQTSPDRWGVYEGVTVINNPVLAPEGDQFIQITSDADFFQKSISQPGVYLLSFDYTGLPEQAGSESVLVRTFEATASGPQFITDKIFRYEADNTFENPDWRHAEYQLVVKFDPANYLNVQILGSNFCSASDNGGMWIDNVKLIPLSAREITDGFKIVADTGMTIFHATGEWQYRYGPSFIINDDGSVDMWASMPGNAPVWDMISYQRSVDGQTWGEDTVALQPTEGSLDAYSTCDPGVIKFGNYYYIGYTSTTNPDGLDNDLFVARSTLPQGPYEKWNGSGWGGNPQPIIEYTDTAGYYGCGEPSFVVKDDVLYIYYTWINVDGSQTRVATAYATNANWPSTINYVGIAIQRQKTPDIAADSVDVKYVEASDEFIAVHTTFKFLEYSYVQVWTSLDGYNFTKSDVSSKNILPHCHNMGISGDESGHIVENESHFIAYGHGTTWGQWDTYLNPVTICNTDYSMDFNYDCTVDLEDFLMFAEQWQSSTEQMDFDDSGLVGIEDLNAFSGLWLTDNKID